MWTTMACSLGTSPRTRGKPAILFGMIASLRNIPAHAGKTAYYWGPNHWAKEHPRARGENVLLSSRCAVRVGTSPRTRGKLTSRYRASHVWRNIPAHAGKTPRNIISESTMQEHPRARGENKGNELTQVMGSGTSPRTRGKLPFHGPHLPSTRNIPAHAGKTIPIKILKKCSKEHPRARGENPLKRNIVHVIRGTSPRTRGKPTVAAGH